jgi:putative CocE/NonD family hydrolase
LRSDPSGLLRSGPRDLLRSGPPDLLRSGACDLLRSGRGAVHRPERAMTGAAPRLAVRPVETLAMRTADGVRLDADVWRPEGPGDHPVLLMRQIYGRRIGCTICYAHPAWYAAHGYMVVVQDSRGRGTSEGRFRFGEHDAADGAEAIDWAAQLPGSTGAVGMYGFSYQGYNQLMAAAGASTALRALAPAMFSFDVRTQWATENGAFKLSGNLGWAIQIAAETARHAGDETAFAELYAAARALPLHAPVAALPELMTRHRELTHYTRWLETPAGDPYWAQVSPSAQAEAILARKLPMLVTGGWYDNHLRGTLDAWQALAPRSQAPMRLVVGPWIHFPWDRRSAGRDFGPEAARSMDALHVRWFDRWLKGIDNGVDTEPAVELFDLGARCWRSFPQWPAARTDLHLGGAGAASIDPGDGTLTGAPAATPGCDHLVHDPWRPAPSHGGGGGTPPGAVDRAGVDARGDVLTFTMAPVTAPVTFAGSVAAVLEVGADAPSFDLACTLSLVTTAGQVVPLADGFCSVTAPPSGPVTVPMRATCVTLAPGEALRLSVAGASFPAFPVNPGTGTAPATTPTAQARIITVSLRHGAGFSSRLSLGATP